METKNKIAKLERIRKRLNFSNSNYVNPIGASGGLALWWVDEVNLDILFKSKHIMRCIVDHVHPDQSWVISFIYAPPNRSKRREFWKLLIDQAKNSNYPWICVGDFNQIGSMWEKLGGAECSRSQIDGFQAVIFECELMDLGFKGCAYTWTNHQGGEANIRERQGPCLSGLAC
ncbi:hypothetical protein CsSME_00026935 [Camellia sinensis var. sinensis]